MKITLLRHAQVDDRYQGCYNGHNGIGLSKIGKIQAKELSKKLSLSSFDAIFCSDLPRAKMTVQDFPHVNKIIYTSKLREKSWGKHEGLKYDEIIALGEIKYINFLQWIKALDGEDYEKYIKRVEKFFLVYLPLQKKENVLVVTHAGVIRVFISIIKNITLEEAFSIKVENTSPIVFNY